MFLAALHRAADFVTSEEGVMGKKHRDTVTAQSGTGFSIKHTAGLSLGKGLQVSKGIAPPGDRTGQATRMGEA